MRSHCVEKPHSLLCISIVFFILNSLQGSHRIRPSSSIFPQLSSLLAPQVFSRIPCFGTWHHPHFVPQVHPVNLQPLFVHGSIGGVCDSANLFLAAWIEKGSMAIVRIDFGKENKKSTKRSGRQWEAMFDSPSHTEQAWPLAPSSSSRIEPLQILFPLWLCTTNFSTGDF